MKLKICDRIFVNHQNQPQLKFVNLNRLQEQIFINLPMNEEESFDLLSEVEIPSWMMQNIGNLEDPSIFIQNQDLTSNKNPKAKSPVSYEIQNVQMVQSSEQHSQSEGSSGEKREVDKTCQIQKNESRNKQQRRNQTSKRYRQRKKQHYKSLEDENRFLRFKIDELTFHLQEVITELNKLKNTPEKNSIPNYHKVKSQCFQQVEKMLQNNEQDEKAYFEMQKKLRSVMGFDGKQKIDLLNYFMSELMENVITDRAFYFINCLINKKGIHRPNDSVELSQIDKDIFEIVNLGDPKKLSVMRGMKWDVVEIECKRFQELWKKLYQVYLAILNQGFKIQRMMEKVKQQIRSIVQIKNSLKLELYFQKNKYRSDFREMRNLWFRELQRENSQKRPNKNYRH